MRYGASPRAAQALVLAGKIQALNRGQAFVSVDDIRAVALPALRHRILLNFEGEADEVNTDTIVDGAARDRRDRMTRPEASRIRARWPFGSKTTSSRSSSTCTSSRSARSPGRTAPIGSRRKRGRGIEFADHRPYSPGDDFRHIDWKAYKRLNRLLLRLFDEEQDLPIYLILDSSRSMAEPAKFDHGAAASPRRSATSAWRTSIA